MKILQINAFHYRKGGSESVYFNTTKILKAHGHEVIHFALKWNKNIKSPQQSYFPESKETRRGIWKPFKDVVTYFYYKNAAENLERLIIQEKPDIAHIHLIWGQLTGAILPVLNKHHIPIVISIHDYRIVCPSYTCKNGKGKICEKCEGKAFYHCITNKCTKDSYILSVIMAAEQYYRNIFFNPSQYVNGLIYVSHFAKKIHEKYMPLLQLRNNIVLYNSSDYIYEDIESHKAERYYLYFGRLSYEKGLETLISVFENLPQCKLKIVGTGPMELPLKTIVDKKECKNIEFLGFQSGAELKRLVRKAYFILVPSEWYENNPMTIIEGYSAGKPVIGAAIGGITEIIQHGETGYLFESGNSKQLTTLLKFVDKINNIEYHHLCNQALKFANENFNVENYYYKLLSFYESVQNEYIK